MRTTWTEWISCLYGEDSERVVADLRKLYPLLDSDDLPSQPSWYKSAQLYSVYPDVFIKEGKGGLFELNDKLDYIQDLGCDLLHVLPFLDSPKVDMGFDVSNYHKVDDIYGGEEGLNGLLEGLGKRQMRLIMDLVLNHTSDEHWWFEKAVQGEEKYQNYYDHVKEKPTLLEVFSKNGEQWARYLLQKSGTQIEMRIMFPDQVGELPHWRQMEDGNWYYHTFYPQQPDLNWHNPEVLLAFLEIIEFWAVKGVNFRLDAVPFLGKDVVNGEIESSSYTHCLVKFLHHFVRTVSNDSIFMVEANQLMPITKSYFSDDEGIKSELAYNFHLTQGIWASMLEGNSEYTWQILEESYPIPDHAKWVNLLRNHDQLSYEFANDRMKQLISTHLPEKGLEMTGIGISGRTAAFLDNDIRKILMAYLLLASLPGIPAIIYGDEIGKPNNYEYMKFVTNRKRMMGQDVEDDTRDINRGWITDEDIASNEAQQIYAGMKYIFTKRRDEIWISSQSPVRKPIDDTGIWACEYEDKSNQMLVAINLSDEEKAVALDGKSKLVVTINQSYIENDVMILPSYAGGWVKV